MNLGKPLIRLTHPILIFWIVFLFICALIFLPRSPLNSNKYAKAETTGVLTAGANAAVSSNAGDNNGFETTPANADGADNNAYANSANTGTGNAVDGCSTFNQAEDDAHDYYNFGTAPTAGSIINGIQVDTIASWSTNSGINQLCIELSWDGGTSWTSTTNTTGDVQTAESADVLGGPANTWGRTWTASELNDSNFRLRVMIDPGLSDTTTASLELLTVTVTYTPPATTLGDGTDGANAAVGPGTAATEIDRFSLATNTGSDTVTGMTITLGPANAYNNIATVDIQTTGSVSLCSSVPSSNSVILDSCGIGVTTSLTEYKILITPKSHASMGAVPGASYATTANVTSITATNPTSGADTDSAVITVDNASPGNVTGAGGTAGDAQATINYTSPADTDLNSVVILRRTGSIVVDVPVEGAAYSGGETIGTATVACVDTSVASSTVDSCVAAGLVNGTAYHFKIFTKDSRGNYDNGVVPAGSPFTPEAVVPITVSGTIYSDEGSTPMTSGPTVRVKINGGGEYFTTANGSGVYSISDISALSGNIVTVFLDGAGEKAVVITRTADSFSNIDQLNLYQDRVIIRHEDVGPVTNANLDQYDSGNDADINFTVTSGILTVADGNKLLVWSGATFAPGGAVTTDPSGSSSAADGDIMIQSDATLSMSSNALSVGGDFANIGAYSASAGQTVTFTATAAGHTINLGVGNLDNLVFNGSGGGWLFTDAVNTIDGDLIATAGAVSGTNDLIVNGGAVTGNGTISFSGGTFLLDGAGNFGGNANWTFSNLTFGDGTGSATTSATGSGKVVVTGDMVVADSQILNAGSKSFESQSGSLVIDGALDAGTSTFEFTSLTNVAVPAYNYYNLTLNGEGTTFTAAGSNLTVGNNLAITSGTFDLNINDPTVTVNNVVISDTLNASDSAALVVTGNWTNNGTFTHNSGTVTFSPTAASSIISGGIADNIFYNFTASDAANKTLEFESGDEVKFEGTLTLTGSDTGLLTIDATSGPRWELWATGSIVTNHLFIKTSGCFSGTNNLLPNDTNIDGHNNGTCWSLYSRGASGTGGSGGTGGGPGGSGSSGGGNSGGGGGGTGNGPGGSGSSGGGNSGGGGGGISP